MRTQNFVFVMALLCSRVIYAESLDVGRTALVNSGSPAAQEVFAQGLGALHDFWYPKAIELFRQAQRIDPGFAMAYWGEAMAHNHPVWRVQDLAAAQEVRRRWQEAPRPHQETAAERALLASLNVLYAPNIDKETRDANYAVAMEAVYRAHPDNVDVVCFYALSLLGLVRFGTEDLHTQLRAASVLELYVQRHGDQAATWQHPGVLHYLIHAYDTPELAPLALPFATAYRTLAQDASHALHMPSHIYVQLGMWEEAAAANQASFDASVRWVKKDSTGLTEYDLHALYWLLYANLQLGQVERARAVVDTMERIATTGQSTNVQGHLRLIRARFSTETGDVAALKLPQTVEALRRRLAQDADSPIGCVSLEHHRANTLLAVGLGAVKSKNAPVAEFAAQQLQQLAVLAPPGAEARLLDIARSEIEGMLRLAQGQPDAGLQLLLQAAQWEADLPPPSGLPVPLQSAIELLGDELLRVGRTTEAAGWFEKSLRRTPNRSTSLFGLARAQAQNGRGTQAYPSYIKLLRSMRRADANLGMKRRADEFLQSFVDKSQ